MLGIGEVLGPNLGRRPAIVIAEVGDFRHSLQTLLNSALE